jgi:hypothetical protein
MTDAEDGLDVTMSKILTCAAFATAAASAALS